MKHLPLLFAFLLASIPASAEEVPFAGFDDFAARYRVAMPAARDALAASFVRWQRARGGFPIVEPHGAVVVWFGTGRERSVAVGGDFKPRHYFSVYWDERGDPMQPVTEGGAVWFRRVPLEPDAGIDYTFRIDGEWRADPLNPRTGSGHQIGVASEVAMQGFAQPAEVVPRPGVQKGTLRALDEPWATPRVQIYLPPGYDPVRSYPVIYTADGDKWIDHGALPTVLDNLIAEAVIRPVIAVAIDAAEDRRDWYYFNSKYLAYLSRVVEWVDRNYSTVRTPAGRLHLGTSSGGRAALWAGLSRPDLFGNVGLFSANYSPPVALVAPYMTGEKRPDARLRVWMSAGSHEPYILDDARAMQAWFERLRQPFRVVYTHGGHNWGTWRSLIKDALRYFYPAAEAVALGPGAVGGEDVRSLAVSPTLPRRASEPGTRARADLDIREMVSTHSSGFVYRALKGVSEIYPFIVVEKLRPGATEGDETVLVASWRGRDMKGGSVLTETFEGDDFADLRWSGGRLQFTLQKRGGSLICTVSGIEADQPAVSCRPAKPAVR